MGALKGLALAAALFLSPAAQAAPLDRWAPQIAEASERFGIPAEWIRRVIRAESGGRLWPGGKPVVSPAGAMGLMQLMPATWRAVRARLGLGDNPHDPRDNILAGTFYLRLMYERFGYPGLFAAYNAGPGRYSRFLSGQRRLPAETRAYVAAVTRGRSATPAAGFLARERLVAIPSTGGGAALRPEPRPAGDRRLFVQLHPGAEP